MLLATPPVPVAVALSVSPARIAVTAPASRTITLRNAGAEDVVVDVTRRAVGESGSFKSWVRVLPARQSIRAGRSARLTLRVSRSATASPGDHALVVLVTTRRPRAEGVAVRLRVGVRVIARMPGRLVRRVELGPVRIRAQRIILPVANRGNVVISTAQGVTATLRRGGRIVARLHPHGPPLLLPLGRIALAFPFGPRLHGLFTFHVRVGRDARRYRVRLS
jgi:hypothetical protein